MCRDCILVLSHSSIDHRGYIFMTTILNPRQGLRKADFFLGHDRVLVDISRRKTISNISFFFSNSLHTIIILYKIPVQVLLACPHLI